MKRPLIVAMIASEMEPFAKTGGLADVAGALPLALGSLGVTIHAFVPRYACVQESQSSVQVAPGVTVHFVDHKGYFHRPKLYGEGNGDYPDNLERFSFFCRQALNRMKHAGIRPDLLHAHDWQSALSIVYLKKELPNDPVFSRTSSVFTVHNLAYQGLFPKEQYPKLGLPWDFFSIQGLEFYDRVNLLKGGLVFADRLTTVSPSYAREIQSPEQGEGLDGVLRTRSQDLVGILNGIDQETWNPATDSLIPHRYDPRQTAPKAKIKAALQKEMGLPVSGQTPLIGMVTRLASQKGLDLVVQALPQLVQLGSQLVVLGTGDRAVEEALGAVAKGSAPIRLRLAFDNKLAHWIYAGSDLFLMPSRYEPCGLGQMIAMRYGTVPVVRSTGGLADTVKDLTSDPLQGNGFSFGPYDPSALVSAVRRAVNGYKDEKRWDLLRRRVMKIDFSWDHSAKEYLRVYEELVYSR